MMDMSRKKEEKPPEKPKPPLKDIMAGRVLDGYVEAARVRPLNQFMGERELDERRRKLLEDIRRSKRELDREMGWE